MNVFWDSPKLSYISGFSSSVLLSSIPVLLHSCTTVYVLPSLWTFRSIWVWAFMNETTKTICMLLYEQKFLFHLCKYVGIGLLGHIVNVCLFNFIRKANIFSTVAVLFCISTSNVWESQFKSYILTVSVGWEKWLRCHERLAVGQKLLKWRHDPENFSSLVKEWAEITYYLAWEAIQ